MNDAAAQRAPAGGQGALIEGLLAGRPRALSRAITEVENAGPGSAAILAAIAPHRGRARTVGVTGPPGAGKSTLIAALIRELRQRGRTVGVLAVDPSSPISGGAILGDRIRMAAHTADPGVFVRSLASRGHLGGLSRTTWNVLQVMDAYGPDVILLETVGSGQSEVEIADFAQTRVVLCAPGAGDDIQAIKAGILEIADILVVTKADLPQAERTARELREMLAMRPMRPGWKVPVLTTVATLHQGVEELLDAAKDHALAAGKRRRHAGKATNASAAPQAHTDDAAAVLVRSLHARDAFAGHNDVQCVAAGPGTATLHMRVSARHLNFNGTCHGGAIFMLADSAFGLACNSRGPLAAGVDSHVTYHRAVNEGDVLVAHAEEIDRGKKLCVYRVEVRREGDGAMISSFTGTAYITTTIHEAT